MADDSSFCDEMLHRRVSGSDVPKKYVAFICRSRRSTQERDKFDIMELFTKQCGVSYHTTVILHSIATNASKLAFILLLSEINHENYTMNIHVEWNIWFWRMFLNAAGYVPIFTGSSTVKSCGLVQLANHKRNAS